MWGMIGCAAFAAPGRVDAWLGPYPGAVEVDGVMTPVRGAGAAASAFGVGCAAVGCGLKRGRGSIHGWPTDCVYPAAPGCRPPPSLSWLQSRAYGFVMGGNGNLLAAHLIYILGGCLVFYLCVEGAALALQLAPQRAAALAPNSIPPLCAWMARCLCSYCGLGDGDHAALFRFLSEDGMDARAHK